jgi:hypothetical protein
MVSEFEILCSIVDHDLHTYLLQTLQKFLGLDEYWKKWALLMVLPVNFFIQLNMMKSNAWYGKIKAGNL